jgi:alanine racemase
MTAPLFPSWLEVDLDAVESNVRWLRRTVGPATQVAAVVKAQAYGLGAEEIARAAIRGGASRLAVARVQEGAALRRAGIDVPILILSSLVASEVGSCCHHGLTATVADPATLQLLDRTAEGIGCALPVHLKVDTGLTRYGARLDAAFDLAEQLLQARSLVAEGLYTHFAASDEADLAFTYEQMARFNRVRARLTDMGLRFNAVHAANSAGAIRVPEARFDLVRAGITVSGYAPSTDVPVEGLRPAARLQAVLARTYALEPGATIGYGRTYTVTRPMRAGLVPLGYADGIPRVLSNRGEMLVCGQRVPMIGRVSMDQCVVDITHVPDAREGQIVTALGAQANDEITLDAFSSAAETIPHETLCRLGPRLPRIYRRGGDVSRVLVFESADIFGNERITRD